MLTERLKKTREEKYSTKGTAFITKYLKGWYFKEGLNLLENFQPKGGYYSEKIVVHL